ncbi:MAG: LPS-assembly protein LptD [Bacteroidales bacterium]|nr:LPS-assembly protein LptD [Bacteroidales bacterium]
MSINFLTRLSTVLIVLGALANLLHPAAFAQDTLNPDNAKDTTIFSPDTLRNDTLRTDTMLTDTLQTDTLQADTTKQQPEYALDARVDYQAKDSVVFNMKEQKAYMYNNAKITYQNIKLVANSVDINFPKNLVYAKGTRDSTGKLTGKPVFTEGAQSFKAESMKYNYQTKDGFISGVITEEQGGYIHGGRVKKLPNDVINIDSGSYTTCNLEDPHFELRYKKAKVIPQEKIITGPAYMVIEDVPIPMAVPFGLFPNTKGQQSGVLIPTYGESAKRGFYFENGGFYWGINEYMDLTLRGDIYTRGSWALEPSFGYKKRYKYSGNINMGYTVNVVGEEGTPNYNRSEDFKVNWSHRQDPKARPNSTFSANVNYQSPGFNQFNPTSIRNYQSNTFRSSVAYQTNWGERYSLTANLSHSQNIIDKSVNLKLPEISFSVGRFYPFRRKETVGERKWYEDISVNYSMNAKNEVDTYDSLLFSQKMFNNFRNGVKHSIPISSSIKVLKYFNMTNSINYTERWYSKSIRQHWNNDTIYDDGEPIYGFVESDTITGFQTARDFSFSSSLNTRLYGMVQFKKGPVKAIRHVLNPSIGFSYRPDFGQQQWGYYQYYMNRKGEARQYSIFSGGNFRSLYGSPPSGKSGNINFSLSNNFEMKVRSKKDTVTGTKKIKLLDNLSLSTSYNMAADSLNWSPIQVSGRTTLFDKLDIIYRGAWDFYKIDSTGNRMDEFVWENHDKLLRYSNSRWDFGLDYSIGSSTLKSTKDKADQAEQQGQKGQQLGTEQQIETIRQNPDDYINWDNEWSVSLSYKLSLTNRYSAQTQQIEQNTVQSLSFNGNINITPKWKVGFYSGYDFKNDQFTTTSVNVYRDLHCWQMRFNWIPLGRLKSWNFTISAKSSILQDLKLNKKKDFRDAF